MIFKIQRVVITLAALTLTAFMVVSCSLAPTMSKPEPVQAPAPEVWKKAPSVSKADSAEAVKSVRVQITGKKVEPEEKASSERLTSFKILPKKDVLPYREFLIPTSVSENTSRVLQSFVLFTHRPVMEDDIQRYNRTCKQWLSELESLTRDQKDELSSVKIRTTPLFWPTLGIRQMDSCDNLFNYDYGRAKYFLAKIGNGAEAMEGPLLALQAGDQWLILDISRFTPPDVERAFTTWKQQVCKEDPMSGASMSKFREYFRALIQTYGETILKTFEKVKPA